MLFRKSYDDFCASLPSPPLLLMPYWGRAVLFPLQPYTVMFPLQPLLLVLLLPPLLLPMPSGGRAVLSPP